ncbi:MBL fold metallo-hydrolase [Acetivibrio cellulolyticus]|uniref:MBL fold metallo-hydrolase n=1 Tax=Acetivibrio cellulolyticus TaxID=35830 RepID=UPI0001E2EB98|nr:MBL fold metallo-hydrolase [Acetivibrio cellulolyticus]
MIIKTLVENTSISDNYKCEHGLSLYIETEVHKLLFDLGQKDLFIENAAKMKIDLSQVDTVIISHGHYDHGGGLSEFLKINDKAKIYLQEKAFDKHYSLRTEDTSANIGLDEALKSNDRLVFNTGYLKIDDELELFAGVKGNELLSLSNKTLLMETEEGIKEDTFEHEQSLIITEAGKQVLIAGCAHKGIVNIVKHAISLKGRAMERIISGFHLYNPSTKIPEAPELVEQIAEMLNLTGSGYYTCHCTGLEAYSILKKVMNENIKYMATGSEILI